MVRHRILIPAFVGSIPTSPASFRAEIRAAVTQSAIACLQFRLIFRRTMAYDSLMVFTGNANPKLAEDVVRHLNIHLGRAKVGRFSDGEVMVEILENVRGKDVFVLQSTCMPTNDNLMECWCMVDALKRASAGRDHGGDSLFGLCASGPAAALGAGADHRQSRGQHAATSGVDRLLTMDLHSDQIQGFFDIPVDNIYSAPILLGDLWKHDYQNLVVVSPDVGGVVRARRWRNGSNADLAIIDKRRPQSNVAR